MNKEAIAKYKEENKLSPNLKDKYDLVGVLPGKIKYKNVQYDLRRMSDEVAAILAGDVGFTYLVPKKGVTIPPDTGSKKGATKS